VITQDDIDAFRDDQPVRESEAPTSLHHDFMAWSIYTLWAFGWTETANALFAAAYPVDAQNDRD
jgi:hypothetical protein